ncbi:MULTISPECIES: uroporphyrinogen-III synthase [unclassified Flavobacterium]|uniref:uroporphyrinogen-III synthase n=1 Tax=unclassified Flavobacterium TaxID=196869 RepID=UPI001F13D285|nr:MULTISPECIES: uroporphyrinogen-III synthase [unclassified Flavobacterium]UMY66316.1 uroporphyrinogen-III synthase [Flavobacterium sp. HJ-32-4]
MTRILSTKRLQPNQKQFLLNAGLSVIEADFISVKARSFTLSNVGEYLIFTSANAVKAVDAHPDVQDVRRRPVFCVGAKTADLLDQRGFTVLASEDDAAHLSDHIIDGYRDASFTFFSGAMRLDTLPTQLSSAGVRFNEIEVYETDLTPVKVEVPIDGILFFSPSAVASFVRANTLSTQTCFCIGATTASAVAQYVAGSNPVIPTNTVIAHKPTIENTIVQCINYYKTLAS